MTISDYCRSTQKFAALIGTLSILTMASGCQSDGELPLGPAGENKSLAGAPGALLAPSALISAPSALISETDPCWDEMLTNCSDNTTISDIFDPFEFSFLGGFDAYFDGSGTGGGFGSWGVEADPSDKCDDPNEPGCEGGNGFQSSSSAGCIPGRPCVAVSAGRYAEALGCPQNITLNTVIDGTTRIWVMHKTSQFTHWSGFEVGRYEGTYGGDGWGSNSAWGYVTCGGGYGVFSARRALM